jgi:uncharacterized membrane-anchored protein YitT (DUF2179 family)
MAALKNRRSKFIKVWRIFLIILGCFVLAFGSGVFLKPNDIVSGGVTGIAIIINHYIQPLINIDIFDILVFVINIAFFALGFVFFGKKFAMNTAIASIVYPLFLSLVTRVPFFTAIADQFANSELVGTSTLVAAVFGGMCVGAGVALTFVGGGSTGGVDILAFIFKKFLNLKQSIGSFLIDGSIIVVSAFTMLSNNLVNVFIGILACILTSLMIHLIYVESDTSYIADIISDKADELVVYIREKMDRTTTIFNVVGTYENVERKMVRFVLDKRELVALKDAVVKIDPKAFITISSASTVLGEGFKSLKSSTPTKTKKEEKNKDNN